jgi:hypothetical protein
MYQPGGADAFLAYAVFGDLQELKVSSGRHRTRGLPPGVTAQVSAAGDELRSGPLGSMLAASDPALAAAVASAPACVVVAGAIADPQDLDYLRDTVGLLTAMWDAGAVAILDLQSFRWYGRPVWFSEIFDPDGPVPRHHVSILWSEEDGRLWFHTRGLRKFGRPDISVRRVPPESRDPIIDLCNRLIEMMALGGMIPEGQPVKMKTLPPGLQCRHAGSVDDPDFNNVHVEIAWPE